MAVSRENLVFLLGSVLLMLVCAEAVHARFHSRRFDNAVSACPHGKYYDLKLKECKQCTFCPVNEIVRRPCHKHRDTVCGPFTEFQKFNQAADEENESKDAAIKNVITSKVHHADGVKTKEEVPCKEKDGKVVHETVGSREQKKHRTEPGLATVTTDADQQWKLFALVLIGVLSVVSLLLVIFVVIACYMLKKRRLMEKTVICSSDSQPGGHYFRPPVFTGERINPTDHMRALLAVDSESQNSRQRKENLFRVYNDSASSSLNNVPAYSDEVSEHADDASDSLVANSNPSVCGDQSSGYSSSAGFPEVIPGPSQDYVYFKAPVRHSIGQV